MELKINVDAKLAYPDLKVSVVEVRLTDKIEFNQELINLKKELESKVRRDYKNSKDLERVNKYNLFYKNFDSKVPMEFQIKSILNNNEIPMANPIVTCMFMAELKYRVFYMDQILEQKSQMKLRVACLCAIHSVSITRKLGTI